MIQIQYKLYPLSLIAVREAPHTTHHAQHIVVGRIHADRRGGCRANGVVGHNQHEGGVINAR